MPERIVVRGLGKRFRRYHPDRPRKLKQLFMRGHRHLRPIEEFWGLRHVDLAIGAGRMVGVIGHNGAGKSTLMRLIGGVGRPDEGSVATFGRVGALLNLGAGSHPDLTGRDNVVLTGVIAGLTRREVLARFDSIVAFAELEDFIDSPLRTYSSGMQMRLAFAVAVHTDPDILLIDEVLSVGDAAFQKKCLAAVDGYKRNGAAILLISHDLNQIRLCDEVYWLKAGQVVAHGEPEAICTQYTQAMNDDATLSH
ncbi:MAG: ABC transporter ATP-binding protein [Sulfurifustis sp.]